LRRRLLLLIALVATTLPPAVAVAVDDVVPEATATPFVLTSPAETPAAAGTAPEATPEPLPDPDFIVGDWELQKVPWRQLRLNGGPILPLETAGSQDGNGVPMRPLGPGGQLAYNPTVLAQQGMKRLDSYVQSGNPVHLRQARKFADVLADISSGNRTRRWQPHAYDLGAHDGGWVNANSHGLVLSFLARFTAVSNAPRRLAEAGRLLAAYEQREDNKKWFATVTNGGYLWFEHWPGGRFEHTLNAHLNAMFGLYDYWLVTGSPLAEQYFLGGAATVRDKLHRFRRKNELSRYSLSGTVGSLHYHETHIHQLRALARMTGDKWFARQADRFERDEEAWRAANRGTGR
jgi:hypothetical protein